MLWATHFVARVDDDVCSAKEVGDRAGVSVEQTLPRYGYTISTPIDLYQLGELALLVTQVALES